MSTTKSPTEKIDSKENTFSWLITPAANTLVYSDKSPLYFLYPFPLPESLLMKLIKSFFINSQVFWILCGSLPSFARRDSLCQSLRESLEAIAPSWRFVNTQVRGSFKKKFLLTLFKALWSSSKLLKAPRSSSKPFELPCSIAKRWNWLTDRFSFRCPTNRRRCIIDPELITNN